MKYEIVVGDLLAQPVEVIVNPWNRNIIPWWLLLPQGVSGAIKRRAGFTPFKELAKVGSMPIGAAVLTESGRLPFKGIIHVAGINLCWFATKKSVELSVVNALRLAEQHKFKTIALPLIGAGSGNRGSNWSLSIIEKVLKASDLEIDVYVVKYHR